MAPRLASWLTLALAAACSRAAVPVPDAAPPPDVAVVADTPAGGLDARGDAAPVTDAPPDVAVADAQADAPSCLRDRDAFPGSSTGCPRTYAEARSMECGPTIYESCSAQRCGGYDVWSRSAYPGENSDCVYDPASGALVGARWGTDTTYQDCWFLVWGAATSVPSCCLRVTRTPACLGDAGTD